MSGLYTVVIGNCDFLMKQTSLYILTSFFACIILSFLFPSYSWGNTSLTKSDSDTISYLAGFYITSNLYEAQSDDATLKRRVTHLVDERDFSEFFKGISEFDLSDYVCRDPEFHKNYQHGLREGRWLYDKLSNILIVAPTGSPNGSLDIAISLLEDFYHGKCDISEAAFSEEELSLHDILRPRHYAYSEGKRITRAWVCKCLSVIDLPEYITSAPAFIRGVTDYLKSGRYLISPYEAGQWAIRGAMSADIYGGLAPCCISWNKDMFIKGAKLAFGLEPSVVDPTDGTVLKRIIKKYYCPLN